MSFDLFGQLFGKARRRDLEGKVAIALGPLAKRLGFGLAAAAVVAKTDPGLLTTRAGQMTLGLTFLAGTFPAGAAPAGILTPTSPGTSSLAGAAASAITSLPATIQAALAAPAAQREAKLQASITAGVEAAAPALITKAVDALNKTNMAGFSTDELSGAKDELGGSVPKDLPGLNDLSRAASGPAAVVDDAAGIAEPSVAQTGGNQ